jgi:hypothetical protein
MANAITDFKSLLSEIVSIQLFYRRLNDVELDGSTYNIVFKDVKQSDGTTELGLFFRNEKKDDYAVSLRQLAGLRIATGTITSKWFEEFREDEFGTILQEKAREIAEAGGSLDTLKFKVAAQLRVKNAQVSGVVPVYQDKCYTGSALYETGVNDLIKGKTGKYWETKEYQLGVRALREKLHATPVKKGKATEANEVKLPIFTIL